MDNNKIKHKKKKLDKEHKNLAINSFYSFFFSYGVLVFSLITSFFIARLISIEIWRFLILGLSFIAIYSILLKFLPIGSDESLFYFIPKYYTLNQKTKVKSFIKYAIILKTLFAILIFLISIIFFFFFTALFEINLEEYSHLFLILSSLIIFETVNNTFSDIYRSLEKFKYVFFMLVLKFSIQIGVFAYYFLFANITTVEQIALVLVMSSTIPFLINAFFMINILIKIKSTGEEKLNVREFLKDVYNYGTALSIVNLLRTITNEIRIQAVGLYEIPETVTGYNIATHYIRAPADAILALNKPLMISFTNLDTSNKTTQIEKIYTMTMRYSLFLILLITGILFFFVDFFLFFVYGSSYLIFTLIVKLMLFTILFNILCNYLHNLLRATKKTRTVLFLTLLTTIMLITLFIAGLLLYGIVGAIIGIIIVNLVRAIICVKLTYKIFEIKLEIKKIILIYSAFFISIGLTIFLDILFLNNVTIWISEELNLIVFQNLKALSIIVFLIIFLILTIIFRVFTVSDIENIEALFSRDSIMHKTIRRSLNFLKKFLYKS